MSKAILEEADKLARESAINACWRQWSALGALVSSISPRRLTGIIDPEALLLLSAAFREEERRLGDILSWWGGVGSALLSVQRLRSLYARFPECFRSGLSAFAQAARNHGDRRWRSFATPEEEKQARRPKGTKHAALDEPATVLLRLRAGLGVGVKADLLAVLLGLHGSTVTVKRIVEALGYSKAAITGAAQEMAQASLIQETPGRPVAYFIELEPWARLLKLEVSEEPSRRKRSVLPSWRYWPQVFAFLSHTSHWARSQGAHQVSTYVLSSQARDLYYAHEHAFALNRMTLPQPQRYRGEEYLEGFLVTLRDVSSWLDQNL